jgi:hypothetical protein
MRHILRAALLTGALLTAAAGLAGANTRPERIVFDGNILFNNSQDGITPLPWSANAGPCTTSVALTYSTSDLGTSFFTHNRTNLDPKLVDPFNLANPRWDPQQLSPANCKYAGDAVVMNVPDPWFEQTNYVGAVPYRLADPNSDWTTGWTYYNVTGAGRTDINYSKPVVILQGEIFTSMTLVNTNNYLLRGRVAFAKGTVLTIQPGTYLFGEKATVGYLVIERGAQINAVGTKAQPIVITSDQVPGSMAPGDNGGIVIHGQANANCADFTSASPESCVSEGAAGFFGGLAGAAGFDDADNSGTCKYMRVEYAGKEISPDNELNSWTMNALGTGTQLEYLEAFYGVDDAFEWFGGTGRLKHAVAVGGNDDNFDWQLGWRGFLQFGVCLQFPGRGDKGIEADNSEFNFTAVPYSSPIVSNLTLVGTNPPTGGLGSTNVGIQLRRGTAAMILNSIVLGFRGPGLQVVDPETFANCPGTSPGVFCQGTLTAVQEDETTLSGKLFTLATPNPTSGGMNLMFALPKDQTNVRAQIFDVSGRLVEDLAHGPMAQGEHNIRWAPKHLATGSYFFRVTTENGRAVNTKLVLVH